MAIVKFAGLNEVELKKLEAALKEDDFVTALNGAADAAEVRKILADKGINFTTEEIEKIRETMERALSSDAPTEADLENVTGGGWFTLLDIELPATDKGVKVTIHIPW